MVPAPVEMVSVKLGEPGGQAAGGLSVTVSEAETGTPILVQAVPQLFVAGQTMKRLLATATVPVPPVGIGKIGPGTDLVRTMDLRQAAGLTVQVTVRLPPQA